MSLPITSTPGVSAVDLSIYQSGSALAASGSSAERVEQVTSLFAKEFDQKEFEDLKKWARASVEGRPYHLTYGAFEAHIIMPNEFLERLSKMKELGIKPTTLKEFEMALTTHKISLLISYDKLRAAGKE